MKKKIMMIFTICCMSLFLGVTVLATPGDGTNPPDNGDISINGKGDLKGCYYTGDEPNQKWDKDKACFEDKKLEEVVYNDLKEFYTTSTPIDLSVGTHTPTADNPLVFTGTNMRAILEAFNGEIKAVKKGITSIRGIQFLTHANIINLENNDIRDFTQLISFSASTPVFLNDHYGFKSSDLSEDEAKARAEGWNVYWRIAHNPIERLPYSFGGRLVVKQPATTSYIYPTEEQWKRVYKRNDDETFSGTLNIKKTEVMNSEEKVIGKDGNGKDIKRWEPILDNNNQPTYQNAKIISAIITGIAPNTEGKDKPKPHDPIVIYDGMEYDKSQVPEGYDDENLYFKNVQASRNAKIAVGINQEIHYDTADEFGTITPGSQSFKYYVSPELYVYDSLKVNSVIDADVIITKKDKKTNEVLSGATYTLYLEDTKILEDIETGKDGKATFTINKPGKYKLIETKAPEGYKVDSTPITFEADYGMNVSGGTKTFQEKKEANAGGTSYTAKENEVFIAGFFDKNNNKNISLSLQNNNELPTNIKVNFAKLVDKDAQGADVIKSDVIKNYSTIKDAEDAINSYNGENRNLGKIDVEAQFNKKGNSAISLTQTNEKEPEPETPEEPKKPEPTPPSPGTGDATTLSLFVAMAAISGSYILLRSKKEKR